MPVALGGQNAGKSAIDAPKGRGMEKRKASPMETFQSSGSSNLELPKLRAWMTA